mmetsp:Transcript_29198/g.54660  ORF Transcript_29198/g.54660 Transcript_29198/m.54660 type:complete len:387 (-) Transcript_29198:138-1298(-)|eukprot:CAMPEP_0170177308 /NCGR_PEP_ID=MMETSP0040_2-20121228/9983_1 /TAXON_ID=641309 /ORGANISM="Lotharella oceanica, Strain CCMP622" /LENGTH=386 /DNA_ID=CAMNT_0010419903 /DNA_START=60 /DNA_END=1220 /DNA_ORIENTATION=-
MSAAKDEEDKPVEDISDINVVTKYKKAAEIANNALLAVIKSIKVGGKVVDACQVGDDYIMEQTGKVYNKARPRVEKGIGFPTCVSVNHIVGHFSPLSDDTSTFKDGDLVKIDLGVHIDGYVAVAAHTIVVGDKPATGKKADVLMAAHVAAECAIRMLRPGGKNENMTKMFTQVADDFKVNVVQGVLSHQLERNIIDGEKVIASKFDPENPESKVEFEFDQNEVYAIDIVMSSGDGKPKEFEQRMTVFKRDMESTYQLKMKASRAVFSDIKERFGAFPFTMRAMDEKKGKFGIRECLTHSLVQGYPVLQEKDGEVVAHIKFTALLTSSGTLKISGLNVDLSKISSEYSVKNEEVKKILATEIAKKKKRNRKKKNKKKDDAKAAPKPE